MTVVIVLAVLALFDGSLTGFRAAAGREGLIRKRVYFVGAVAHGARWTIAALAANAALAAVLVATSADRDATWAELVRAGTTSVWVLGAFATVTLAALAFWIAPIAEYRVLASLIVLGPLTMLRPFVIVGGLVAGAATTAEPRVWIAAAAAAASMLSLERILGRAHSERWRALQRSD